MEDQKLLAAASVENKEKEDVPMGPLVPSIQPTIKGGMNKKNNPLPQGREDQNEQSANTQGNPDPLKNRVVDVEDARAT